MQNPPELDVRTIPPPERHPRIFGAFDALAEGESFVLVNDHYPKPLLYQFQSERPGRFEWSVLEAAPRRFRVQIQRRAEGPRNVTEHLQADHRRLDAIVADVRALLEAGSFAEASARFAEFACGLARHIEIEEEILFPVFEQMTGMAHGPTVVMRHEHVEIRQTLSEIAAALARSDGAAASGSIDALEDVLSDHNLKEERVLYPMTDDAAGDDRAREDLVHRMQAY